MRIQNFRYRNTFGSRWIYLLYGNFEKPVTLVTFYVPEKRRGGSEWSTVIEGWSPLITCNSKMGVKNIAYLCSEHHELDETRSKSVKVQVDLMSESYWCHIELILNSYRIHIELISKSYRTHIGLISDANSENAGSVLSDPLCSCSEV